MGKTVYILGAGFSKESGAPLQSEIVDEIMQLNTTYLDPRYQKIFHRNRESFKKFLEQTLFIEPASFKNVALEDIFTPLDRCIFDNLSFRNISPHELFTIRQNLISLIVILFDHRLRGIENEAPYVPRFAQHLVDLRKLHHNNDPFSVISTNWDIVLDNAIVKKIPEGEGVVDYCCYITPYNSSEKLLPGLLARRMGRYNIKILKLHGSMNWLRCQRCQRLFVTFFEKIALNEFFNRPKCRLCDRNFSSSSGNDGGALLVSDLVKPTFLKDLDDVQIKLVWQNAGVELSEAHKLVFIGYSFPMADFEFRQLLSRSVRHTAEIEVILCDKDDPSISSARKEDLPEFRYCSFFGKRSITFSYDGVAHYVNQLANTIVGK